MKRRAFSPVIASIILAATVISVGGAVWFYAYGAGTVVSENHIDEVLELINEISERFIVEHVGIDDTHIRIWIYNYGEIPIVVDVYATIEGGASVSSMEHEVDVQELIEVDIELVVIPGDEVSVKAVSRRGNNEAYRFFLPIT